MNINTFNKDNLRLEIAILQDKKMYLQKIQE